MLAKNPVRDRELLRLDPGDAQRVVIEAKCPHNETGLWMVAGEKYAARYISCVGWKDGSYDAEPTGVTFRGLTRLLAKALERLRPFPRGAWFEVIGRIDGGSTFQALSNPDASIPREFEAVDSGELVLMVNDVFYSNNEGVMTIEVQRLP